MSSDSSGLSKKERVNLILKALNDAPAVASREQALALLDQVFRNVEDMYSGVPHEPHHVARLYPPVASMERQVEGKPWMRRYRHTSHYTLIADNGAIVIGIIVREKMDDSKMIISEHPVLNKPGSDGRCVADWE